MVYITNINGIDVRAEFTDDDIKGRYIPFLRELSEKQKIKNKRLLVMLAAPPGCGKTTLLQFLKKLSEETEGITPVTVIGMDGFHRYQEYLCSHTAIVRGEKVPLVRIKGAPITFDLEKLKDAVKRVAGGEDVGWPYYDRMTHNPKENAIHVTGDIVILEGNYLLLEKDGWKELRNYADVTVKMTADEEFLRKRLIERHHKSGKALSDAAAFVDFSDMENVKICLNGSGKADIEWKIK